MDNTKNRQKPRTIILTTRGQVNAANSIKLADKLFFEGYLPCSHKTITGNGVTGLKAYRRSLQALFKQTIMKLAKGNNNCERANLLEAWQDATLALINKAITIAGKTPAPASLLKLHSKRKEANDKRILSEGKLEELAGMRDKAKTSIEKKAVTLVGKQHQKKGQGLVAKYNAIDSVYQAALKAYRNAIQKRLDDLIKNMTKAYQAFHKHTTKLTNSADFFGNNYPSNFTLDVCTALTDRRLANDIEIKRAVMLEAEEAARKVNPIITTTFVMPKMPKAPATPKSKK